MAYLDGSGDFELWLLGQAQDYILDITVARCSEHRNGIYVGDFGTVAVVKTRARLHI